MTTAFTRAEEISNGLRCAVCEERFEPGDRPMFMRGASGSVHPWDDEEGQCIKGNFEWVGGRCRPAGLSDADVTTTEETR